MLLAPHLTVDPRDNLDKAHRRELIEFAQANGLEIDPNMPADDIEGKQGTGLRNLLRSKGLTRIVIPHRTIKRRGTERTFPIKTMAAQAAPAVAQQATSDEWAEFQKFKAFQASRTVKVEKLVGEMTMGELRTAAKAKGVKIERRDNMETLRAKLNGG